MSLLKPLRIGPWRLPNNLVLAPMAGVTDRPFREICAQFGAGMTVSEMVAANPDTRHTRKSSQRTRHGRETTPVAVQIVGSDPQVMAGAARYNIRCGARIIDINMGCPAKKVCRKLAGSALLTDEGRVRAILEAVTGAVDVPVTLKIRTGVSPERRNGVRIAEIAQASGIQSLAVHGRTRADLYRGEAEYDTIADICRAVEIPVLANGDIDSPEKAVLVLEKTGADGLMIGRAARGQPWIFRDIAHYLTTGQRHPAPGPEEIEAILLNHLRQLHRFHGELAGVRIARKHIGWYLRRLPGGEAARMAINRIEDPTMQREAVAGFFQGLKLKTRRAWSSNPETGTLADPFCLPRG